MHKICNKDIHTVKWFCDEQTCGAKSLINSVYIIYFVVYVLQKDKIVILKCFI